MGKVLCSLKYSALFLLSFVVFFQFAQAEDLYYCFRLEGVKMNCAGGIEVTPTTSPPPTPCTETCENTTPHCNDWTICIGKPEQKVCPGTGQQPNCSERTICTIVTASQSEETFGTSSCTYPTGTVTMCGAPIKGNGEGCTCLGSCNANGSNCEYSGSSPGCTSSCSCGPGTQQQQNSTKYWCESKGTQACNVYQRNVPAVNDGQCGCKCPDPGGSLSTPECGRSFCSPEPRPPECG